MNRSRPSLNRRSLAKFAAFAGSSLIAASAVALPPATSDGLLNVRHFGAKGDGKADDTAALQRAIDTAASLKGGVLVPPGEYPTSELHMRPGISLIGYPAWDYWGPGGSILRLLQGNSTCLLNLTDARGSTIDGLCLVGADLGQDIHGMAINRSEFAAHEDALRIERCQITHFTGDALHLQRAWVFNLRHSMLAHNKGDGLNYQGWDAFILDNWLSDNGRAGFAARYENEGASITFTGNRVEWNKEENVLLVGNPSLQITGNHFDRAGTYGLALRRGPKFPVRQSTITGNNFSRSGKNAKAGQHESSHLFMEGCSGVACIGNTFSSGQDDGGKGRFSPNFGIVYQGLENCVIANNVLHEGALRELLVDLGHSHDGVVIRDNPGKLLAV